MPAASGPRRRWTPVDWAVLTCITLIAGGLRFARVTYPSILVYDEYYYAREACWYLLHAKFLCGIPLGAVHPPLAKWLIALGIAVFGYTPLGWRIASVLAGTATVAALYLLARRILGSTTGAAFAAGLLAIDFLHFVHSRVAMLDVFVTLFGLSAFLFCIYDRDYVNRHGGATRSRGGAGILARPWRIAAGAAAGAAVASKWPGVFALFAVLFLTIVWELSARLPGGKGDAVRRTLREEGLSIGLWLLLLPVSLYIASYAGTLSGNLLTTPWAKDSWVRALGQQHYYMLRAYSTVLHSYEWFSPPWMWILGREPVIYFLSVGESTVSTILALGSPFVWWLSIPALMYVATRVIRSRDPHSAEFVITAGFAFSYAPWFAVTKVRGGGLVLWHFLPTVPFLCLALGYVVARIARPDRRIVITTALALGSMLFFGYTYPILTGSPLPETSLSLFGSPLYNCDVLRNFALPENLRPRSC